MALFGKKNDKEKELPSNEPNESEKNEAAENIGSSEPAEPIAAPVSEPQRREYTTPEGFDFNRYFLADRRIVLDNISYETLRPVAGQLKMNVKDMIVAQVMGQAGVKVTYNRTLTFDPEGLFRLSVTFGVMLVFNPGTRGEIDWRTIDVAAEFKKNCPQLVDVMASKATLLIAEITNSSGGNPIILRK